MLAKDQRLNLRQSFKWVISGKRQENSLFKLFYRTGDNSHPLVGIATSGKVMKHATARNRARRLLSTAIQPLYSQLPPSINIVIMPKNELLPLSSDQLHVEMENLLKKAALL